MTEDERRKLWRQYGRDHERAYAPWRERGYIGPAPVPVPFPDELRGLTCGAKTRAGTPCQQKGLYDSGRCKLHGGMSTGPKTAKGKKQSRINGRKGGRPPKNPSP